MSCRYGDHSRAPQSSLRRAQSPFPARARAQRNRRRLHMSDGEPVTDRCPASRLSPHKEVYPEMVLSPSAAEGTARPGPLAGVRVLDLGDSLTIYAGKLLADLGADVLLVEPPGGVPARELPPFFHDQPGPATSLSFWFFNTSKRSLT